MTDNNVERPRVLIEDWLPVTELGIESKRERSTPTPHAFPPINQLHVWWARRPLVASAAVVLAGLLPTWSPELAERFSSHNELSSATAYRQWFLRLVGIWGDPAAAVRSIADAKSTGTRLDGNGFGYKQAYKNGIPRDDVDLLHTILIDTWGTLPLVADPTAGGGSIPFAASRYGLPVFANDLNGVAASVIRAGVEIPAREGGAIVEDVKKWGRVLTDRLKERLEEFFPLDSGEAVTAYIWANAVRCPRTGRLVPLMPDFWLRKTKGKEVAVRLVTECDGEALTEPEWELLIGAEVDPVAASAGTVKRGNGISPYDNLVIDGDYIKTQAQNGDMEHVLYALAIKKPSGERTFRLATSVDRAAVAAAEKEFNNRRVEWEASGVLPTEEIPEGLKTAEPRRYGMYRWIDMYLPRQALVHSTFVEEYLRLADEVREQCGDRANDILWLLGIMQGKGLNYNSRLSFWHTPRQSMGNVFARHDLAFLWTFAEFEGARALPTWILDQLLFAYQGQANLLEGTARPEFGVTETLDRLVTVTSGSATSLPDLADGSVSHLCMDPPYYDNVMYGELSDYFYVWEKRTLGMLEGSFFADSLADKDNEAVANVSRFESAGKRKKELADLDYEAKMTAIFAECRRVLRDDGVLSVMFTHKRAEAWDTLGMGLMQAGFTVETSWPVNTEAEHSAHQADKNSAASTVMLVCRKRENESNTKVFLDDIEARVRESARVAATTFRDLGIDGVDLLLSTYGPALSVISANWPVYSTFSGEDGRARLLRPEEALTMAREEVVRMQRARIVGREVQIDNHSDFVLIAWETFKAHEFPYDEARRLALAVGGLDVDAVSQAKILDKKAGMVRLLAPKERIRRGSDDSSTGVRIDATRFEYMNDALDTVLYVAEVDGMGSAKSLMDRIGLTGDQRFLAYVQGLVNTMPRMKVKGEWVVPEAGLLDTLVTAYLPEITLPAEVEEPVETVEEQTLFD